MSETKNDVSQRHRQEWRTFQEMFLRPCMADKDPDLAKTAKAIADVLKVYQEGERKAWDFTEQETTDANLSIAWES